MTLTEASILELKDLEHQKMMLISCLKGTLCWSSKQCLSLFLGAAHVCWIYQSVLRTLFHQAEKNNWFIGGQFDYHYLKANKFKAIVCCFTNGYLGLQPSSISMGCISNNALRLYQSISKLLGHFVHYWMDCNQFVNKKYVFSLCSLCPQAWIAERSCMVWHCVLSFSSFLGGHLGGWCDGEEVTWLKWMFTIHRDPGSQEY